MQVKSIIQFLTICVVFFFNWELFSQKNVDRTVIIGLEWQLNVHHGVLLIAEQAGYFKDQGLHVNFVTTGGNQEGCKMASIGKVDFAVTSQPQFYVQNDRGFNLRFVATLIRQPLEVILSRYPLSHLKGKTVAHTSNVHGFSLLCFKKALESNNLSLDDVKLLHSKQSLLMTLLSGQVDAIINIYKTSLDPRVLEKHGLKACIYRDYGVPDYAPMILVTSDKTSLELSKRVQKAIQKSLDLIQHSPEEAAMYLKQHPKLLDTKSTHEIWCRLMEHLPTQTSDLASMIPLKTMVKVLQNN